MASIIPGGGVVAHTVIGRLVDTAIVDGQETFAGQMDRNAWNNRQDIADMDDAIDAMGDRDGIAEMSDIFSNWF